MKLGATREEGIQAHRTKQTRAPRIHTATTRTDIQEARSEQIANDNLAGKVRALTSGQDWLPATPAKCPGCTENKTHTNMVTHAHQEGRWLNSKMKPTQLRPSTHLHGGVINGEVGPRVVLVHRLPPACGEGGGESNSRGGWARRILRGGSPTHVVMAAERMKHRNRRQMEGKRTRGGRGSARSGTSATTVSMRAWRGGGGARTCAARYAR